MAFRTKIDYSSNRQIKQTEQTVTALNGRTDFGLPFSGLSSGAKLSTSAATNVYENVVSTFIGNLTATTFTFGHSAMTGSQIYLNVITPVNSNTTQIVNPHFVGQNGSINPNFGNTAYTHYTAVSYDFSVTNFVEYAPNQFSGTAVSEAVTTYVAGSWDYTGDGVWLKVRGKLSTEKLIVTSGASSGKVLTCINSSGDTAWSSTNLPILSGGVATFTGDGVTTAFLIPHGLGETPIAHTISKNLDNSGYDFSSSATTTNIVVNFTGIVPTGGDIIKYNWIAFK